ncbi:DUF6305 family protein [Carboxydothermus pertinax]|uniref:DUF6305 domain-containing protein n=1 Tax=Carboxydothermus pertinax TaxID=870242 RepID=A0A1L8CYE1_9THEO|nr:DUF6305 family protein [Carboxydothermus pertinax]GAV23884.1 hypothetical protein cpu_23940 [Carboxydothermus pertinax]
MSKNAKMPLGVVLGLIFMVLASWFTLNILHFKNLNSSGGFSSLPRPIGREPVLVTTIGQGIDGLLVSEYFRDLHAFTAFRQKAEAEDLRDMRTFVLVIGTEFETNQKLDKQFQEELAREQRLITKAKKLNIPVVLVCLRNYPNLNRYDRALFSRALLESDYVLLVGNCALDKLVSGYNGYYTRVLRLQDLKVPLNSILR